MVKIGAQAGFVVGLMVLGGLAATLAIVRLLSMVFGEPDAIRIIVLVVLATIGAAILDWITERR